ncbi:MAG: radical SAM protein [Actinomycetota bacterium]|nr:radical SAM protein [Actinomycetota bacterium]MDD5667875.1 radical SAM protein [Actinomycetota bacterium]
MYYEEPVFRPPCEARSLIIQVTLGCPHNRCVFCAMYKMKKYRVRDVEDVKADLRQARLMHRHVESIFLADGNTIAMNSDKLADIISYARHLFPEAERVSSYGGARFLKGKPPEALRRLREAGLDIIYLGLESGDDEILAMMDKGVDSEGMIEAARRVKEAGIALSVYVLLGLGGEDLWRQHAENTARVLNAMRPDFIRPRTLALLPGMPLYEIAREGGFREAGGETIMRELQVMLGALEVENAWFLSDHISNYVPIYGHLPEDREQMLASIEMALENPREYLGPRHLTHL